MEFLSKRRFGVEIELNSFDQRNFNDQPLNREAGELPQGIDEVAVLISDITNQKTIVKSWHSTHNNRFWVIKPDRSCGMEVCSPPLTGPVGVRTIGKVIKGMAADTRVKIDKTCSMHVHVNMEDWECEVAAAITAWWIKCERIFLAAFPFHRKRNRYCQFIGLTDLFEHDSPMRPESILQKIGKTKYLTLNAFHYLKNSRRTLEFRIAGYECCQEAKSAENWIKLVLWFCERAAESGLPSYYRTDNKWTSFLWLDLADVFSFLRFDKELTGELQELRDWFLSLIVKNIGDTNSQGIWREEIVASLRSDAFALAQKWGVKS